MISLKELGIALSKREHNTATQTGVIEGVRDCRRARPNFKKGLLRAASE